MTAPQPILPPKQRQVLFELKRIRDSQGRTFVGIHDLATRTRLKPEHLARTLQLLSELRLVEWHFYFATPWYDPSEGTITSEGYNIAYSMPWGTRVSRFAFALVPTLTSSAITTVVSNATSPQGLTALVVIIPGTAVGTAILVIAMRKLNW